MLRLVYRGRRAPTQHHPPAHARPRPRERFDPRPTTAWASPHGSQREGTPRGDPPPDGARALATHTRAPLCVHGPRRRPGRAAFFSPTRSERIYAAAVLRNSVRASTVRSSASYLTGVPSVLMKLIVGKDWVLSSAVTNSRTSSPRNLYTGTSSDSASLPYSSSIAWQNWHHGA